jgi:AcrR family transcriptional regulator
VGFLAVSSDFEPTFSPKVFNMPNKSFVDHRPRVAAERRERMRKLLLESAMLVFAQKGVSSTVIHDVVAAANVSQGSFYKYFRTSDDLFHAVAEELSNEVVRLIEAAICTIENPALRVATAIRSYLHLMRNYPVVAQFIVSAGLRLANKKSAVYHYLPRDLKAGQKRGYFDALPANVAIDMIGGAGLMSIYRMVSEKTTKNYPERVVCTILRSLGVGASDAALFVAHPLPKLVAPLDSLLSRAQARLVANMPEGARG